MNAARMNDVATLAKDDEFYQVSVDQLTTGAYNRVVSDDHVRSLMDAFALRPWAMPALECNMRESGQLVVINGQHRTEAARRMGWTTIRAVVHFGWTEAQEAQAFRDSAKGKGINSLDQWWAAKLAGEPDVLAIEEVLSRLELWVPRRHGDSRKPGAVSCPGALMSVAHARLHGTRHSKHPLEPARVEDTLSFVLAAWGDDPKRFDGRLLRALGHWLGKFSDHPAFSRKDAIRKLGAYDPSEVVRRMQAVSHNEAVDIVTAGTRVLTGLYDRNRRGPRLRPTETEGEEE